eukprot:m.264730 g.264730  ORF g.264730 m.264730 type:complete len:513 (-) comp57937_c0_seq1:4-1542(-)
MFSANCNSENFDMSQTKEKRPFHGCELVLTRGSAAYPGQPHFGQWFCDRCGNQNDGDTNTFHCSKCKVDYCESCVDSCVSPLSPHKEHQNPTTMFNTHTPTATTPSTTSAHVSSIPTRPLRTNEADLSFGSRFNVVHLVQHLRERRIKLKRMQPCNITLKEYETLLFFVLSFLCRDWNGTTLEQSEISGRKLLATAYGLSAPISVDGMVIGGDNGAGIPIMLQCLNNLCQQTLVDRWLPFIAASDPHDPQQPLEFSMHFRPAHPNHDDNGLKCVLQKVYNYHDASAGNMDVLDNRTTATTSSQPRQLHQFWVPCTLPDWCSGGQFQYRTFASNKHLTAPNRAWFSQCQLTPLTGTDGTVLLNPPRIKICHVSGSGNSPYHSNGNTLDSLFAHRLANGFDFVVDLRNVNQLWCLLWKALVECDGALRCCCTKVVVTPEAPPHQRCPILEMDYSLQIDAKACGFNDEGQTNSASANQLLGILRRGSKWTVSLNKQCLKTQALIRLRDIAMWKVG